MAIVEPDHFDSEHWWTIDGPTNYDVDILELDTPCRCGTCSTLLRKPTKSALLRPPSSSAPLFLARSGLLVSRNDVVPLFENTVQTSTIGFGHSLVWPTVTIESSHARRRILPPCPECGISSIMGIARVAADVAPLRPTIAVMSEYLGDADERAPVYLASADVAHALHILAPDVVLARTQVRGTFHSS